MSEILARAFCTESRRHKSVGCKLNKIFTDINKTENLYLIYICNKTINKFKTLYALHFNVGCRDRMTRAIKETHTSYYRLNLILRTDKILVAGPKMYSNLFYANSS